MGYGSAGRIGAKFAAPDRRVIVVSGDGSIQMNIQELGTAVQYGVDIKVIILNNHFLGMVRQWQEKFYDERYSTLRCRCPTSSNWPTLMARRVFALSGNPNWSGQDDERGVCHPRPGADRRRNTEEEAVMPMMPPGGSMSEMLFA